MTDSASHSAKVLSLKAIWIGRQSLLDEDEHLHSSWFRHSTEAQDGYHWSIAYPIAMINYFARKSSLKDVVWDVW